MSRSLKIRMLVLTAAAIWLVWMITVGSTPSWYDSLEAARAAADERLVVAVIHDPDRVAAQGAFEELRRSTRELWKLGDELVLVDLHSAEVPADWGLDQVGFALRAMEADGCLIAQRSGILAPHEFSGFLRQLLSHRGLASLDHDHLSRVPRGVQAYLGVASSYRALDCRDQERDALERVLAHPDLDDGSAATARTWLALNEARQGQASRAWSHFQWLEDHVHDKSLEPVLLLARAHVAHVERNDQEAERHLRKLIKDHPSSELVDRARVHLFHWVESPPD